jgi:hypothetical protein
MADTVRNLADHGLEAGVTAGVAAGSADSCFAGALAFSSFRCFNPSNIAALVIDVLSHGVPRRPNDHTRKTSA